MGSSARRRKSKTTISRKLGLSRYNMKISVKVKILQYYRQFITIVSFFQYFLLSPSVYLSLMCFTPAVSFLRALQKFSIQLIKKNSIIAIMCFYFQLLITLTTAALLTNASPLEPMDIQDHP